jgi:hypothetical protein
MPRGQQWPPCLSAFKWVFKQETHSKGECIVIDAYIQQFTKKPASMAGIVVMVFTHAVHGVHQFYVPNDVFQASCVPIIRGAWVNGFVVVIYPAIV